ncbi:glycosyltransferase [Salinimicrobium sp. CAU 1759]
MEANSNANKIAIVLPCYNEEERFSPELFLAEIALLPEVDFLFVDDGSTDNTFKILKALCEEMENLDVIRLERNAGKAEAVRKGVQRILSYSQYTHVGYFDADLATPLSQLNLFLNQLGEENEYQILFGSRIKRAGATIERNQIRHYLGRVMATVVNNTVVKIPVYDTQCGAKLLTVGLAREIFNDPFISKWLFDIELIARLQMAHDREKVTKMVYEVPLTVWIEKGKTKIRFRDVLRVPFQLLKIGQKYKGFQVS